MALPPRQSWRAFVPALVVLFAALCAGAALARPASAATYTFTPTADTYARSDRPSATYAKNPRISAMKARKQVRRAYLRFKVAVPASERVTGATLNLYSTSKGTRSGVALRALAGQWHPARLSWRNAPQPGRVLARARGYGRHTWVTLDATRMVRGSGLVSLALTSRAPSWQGFGSREDRRHAPRLVVTTASPSAVRRKLAPPPLLVGPGLHTTPGHAFVDAGGNAVQLRGLNLVPIWRGSPGRTWDQARYDQIAAKGFNVVRLVLYWSDFEPQPGAFDQTSLQTLDTAIARAKAAGLRVILDEIHIWGANGGLQDVPAWARTGDSVDTVNANATGLVRMFAARYRDEQAVAAYDPVNEPHRFPVDANGVLRMYDGLIQQIRAVDPYKIILVEPSYGDSSALGSDVDFRLLSDRRNIVWAPHDYFAGGDATGYDAQGWQRGSYVWDGQTGYNAPNRGQLASHLEVQLDAAAGAALPVWIGEFGIAANAPNRDAWIADQVSLFREHGLGYSWWEYHTTDSFSATAADFSWQPWIDLLV